MLLSVKLRLGRWSWKRNLFAASLALAGGILMLAYCILLYGGETPDPVPDDFQCPMRPPPYHHGNGTTIRYPRNALGHFGEYSVNETHLRSVRISSHAKNVNCPAMFAGVQSEIANGYAYMASHDQPRPLQPADYVAMTTDCESFRQRRGYILSSMSREEECFPIAYSILMYKDIEQMERLLRTIYAPQNAYCIHVDRKADVSLLAGVQAIARCFPNVIVAREQYRVYWAHVSTVHAELSCIRDLLQYSWKYVINLTGQMFPLHSNLDLVRTLRSFNGANDVEGFHTSKMKFFLRWRVELNWHYNKRFALWVPTLSTKTPPDGITLYKGNAQAALSRGFAEYAVHSGVACRLLRWLSNSPAPDEFFRPTLNHNAHLSVPGSFLGDPDSKPFVTRVNLWHSSAFERQWSFDTWPCHGKWVRLICILGLGDLPWLYNRPELFANKFFSDYQWLAYDCMEELILNRTLHHTANPLNTHYYAQIPFVRNASLVVR